VGLGDELLQLVPIDRDVQVDAHPTTMADVWRPEEPDRIGLDQAFLAAGRRGQPDGEPVVVVMVRRRRKRAGTDEPGRLAVAQPLGDVGQRFADRAEPGDGRRIARPPDRAVVIRSSQPSPRN